MEAVIYNRNREKVGSLDLPESIFGLSWHPQLVSQALIAQIANRRRPLASVKDRGEVSGGGRKPWRQKHTGRARAGSIRSPIWVHGGIAHGPNKEKVYSQKINKKMKKLALFSVLAKKFQDQEILLVENLDIGNKTKDMADFIRNFFGQEKKASVLFIPRHGNKNVFLAARNIPGVDVLNPALLNIEDCLTHKYLVFEKEAMEDFLKKIAEELTQLSSAAKF